MKKIVMGFDVSNIYETEYWAEFVRLFWPLAIGFIILINYHPLKWVVVDLFG